MALDDKNPWDGILASTVFTPRAAVHTTRQYTSAQLIFGHALRLIQRYDVDWEKIGIKGRVTDNLNIRELTAYKE